MAKRRSDRRVWHQYPIGHLALAKRVAAGALPARHGPLSYSDAQVHRYTFNAFREALRLAPEREADEKTGKLSYPTRMYNILQELIVRVVREEDSQCYVEYDLHPTTRLAHNDDPTLAQAFSAARAAFAKAQQIPSET